MAEHRRFSAMPGLEVTCQSLTALKESSWRARVVDAPGTGFPGLRPPFRRQTTQLTTISQAIDRSGGPGDRPATPSEGEAFIRLFDR
jgi:hypothetical protein